MADRSRDFEALLDFLKRNRGFDFTGYKRSSLHRRIEKRMQAVTIDDFEDYTSFLDANPGEFSELFNTVLINVTTFFRDDPTWSFLSSSVVPELLKRNDDGSIRVWSAGCATGQEAY